MTSPQPEPAPDDDGPSPRAATIERRVRIAAALVVAGLVGVCGGLLAVWVTDLASPTRPVTAVVSDVHEFVSHNEGDTYRETRNASSCRRTSDPCTWWRERVKRPRLCP